MEKTIEILIDTEADVPLPEYASEGAAGADVRAHLATSITLAPGESRLIPTGLRIEIPRGYEIQLRPRSGLALKYQITILNTPGTIDADYRGEIQVLLVNWGSEPFTISPGMRIAQMVVAPVVRAQFLKSSSLATTVRGAGGFGHTGL